MRALSVVAPAFVQIAHRIVWCTAATVAASGAPRTRVLHPIWEFDGDTLTGWIATSPASPKAADLAHESRLSITYWAPDHDTCTVDCDTVWETDAADRAAAGIDSRRVPHQWGTTPRSSLDGPRPTRPDSGSSASTRSACG